MPGDGRDVAVLVQSEVECPLPRGTPADGRGCQLLYSIFRLPTDERPSQTRIRSGLMPMLRVTYMLQSSSMKADVMPWKKRVSSKPYGFPLRTRSEAASA